MKITRNNRKDIKELHVDESIFALQNGLIGVRGQFAEGYGGLEARETLINGFYNDYNYNYEENSPTFPQKGQRMINAVDGQGIDIFLQDQKIDMHHAKLLKLERHFFVEEGYTERLARYQTPQGNIIEINEKRIVSFEQRALLVIRLEISSPNYQGPIRILSNLTLPSYRPMRRVDSRINKSSERELIILDDVQNEDCVGLMTETTKSKLRLACGMTHNQSMQYERIDDGYQAYCHLELNEPVVLEKYVVYQPQLISDDPLYDAIGILRDVLPRGFAYYKSSQKKYVERFWSDADIEIIGQDKLNDMLRYNLYQLHASGFANDAYSIPAKGLTGEGYEGHYFWDTEIYMVPFFTFTRPEIAKALLKFRIRHLEEARLEAIKHGVSQGVKIPWRTINGHEVSPYYPAGSAQYHINADIAYALMTYYDVTHDLVFMLEGGFELLLETARFLYEAGNFYEGEFNINTVTGPDEYTTLVNNNYYTNAMVQYHFNRMVQFYRQFKGDIKQDLDDEMAAFEEAAKAMKLPYDSTKKVFSQDDAFMQKKPFDINAVPADKLPMLLHFHPLFIYKHQILKQADVLLALILLRLNDLDALKRNFDFYLPKTTHDSSLSKCIHSIAAFRLGEDDLGFEFFEDICTMDLQNTHKNTDHGLHIANAGGIYLSLLLGVLGIQINNDNLQISPRLPKQFKGLKATLTYRQTKIEIHLEQKIKISVEKPLMIGIYDELVEIKDDYHCDYREKQN